MMWSLVEQELDLKTPPLPNLLKDDDNYYMLMQVEWLIAGKCMGCCSLHFVPCIRLSGNVCAVFADM